MRTGDQYRAEAARCEQAAQAERDPRLRESWHKMATTYYRLAALADKNDKGDLDRHQPR